MEYLIRILKIAIVAAILYAAYYFLIKDNNQDKPEVYVMESTENERVIESPESVTDMTFKSDDGLSIHLLGNNQCKVIGTNEEEGFKIKGTPHYKYKKKNNLEGVLNIDFITSREKGRELLETEYRYEYELKFTKPTGGRTHCNYVFLHKIGAGDKVKSFVEADTRPTWFELN